MSGATTTQVDRDYISVPRSRLLNVPLIRGLHPWFGGWEQRRTDVAVPDIMKGTHDSGDRNCNISILPL